MVRMVAQSRGSQLGYLFGSEAQEQVLKEKNVMDVHEPKRAEKAPQMQDDEDIEIERKIRGMTLPDLRIALRGLGLSPAGGLDALRERLLEATKGTEMKEQGGYQIGSRAAGSGNNYQRPEGQNVGNFITDRPSSRVLKAPGGGSQITFG